jgi:hypothetical protein
MVRQGIREMDRRDTIKTLMLGSAALATLPSWAQGWEAKGLRLPVAGSFLDEGEKAILSAVADTIIPAGNAIGALEVEVDAFLLRLFTDCYEPDVQQNLKLQFRALEVSATLEHGKAFAACSQPEREALLLAMAASEVASQAEFFNLVKGETIRGFLTSRKVMRDFSDYVVAPGFFNGCADISNT